MSLNNIQNAINNARLDRADAEKHAVNHSDIPNRESALDNQGNTLDANDPHKRNSENIREEIRRNVSQTGHAPDNLSSSYSNGDKSRQGK